MVQNKKLGTVIGRNPLKSGQCFLHIQRKLMIHGLSQVLGSQSPQIGSMFPTKIRRRIEDVLRKSSRRNPLKSGQCFLQALDTLKQFYDISVAIPSNRVNVSYMDIIYLSCLKCYKMSRSQSPQIGSMFPTNFRWLNKAGWVYYAVAIPSNRVNVSYMIYFDLKSDIIIIKYVAIPSNRVNVSYANAGQNGQNSLERVAIPSNRVNVSYI